MERKKTLAVILGTILALALVVSAQFIIKNYTKNPEIAYLKINCDGNDISNIYKEGDSFNCALLNLEFKLTIKSIKNNKVKIQADKYGLYPKQEDGTISLIDNEDKFELYKNKKTILELQATDVSSTIEITYENQK